MAKDGLFFKRTGTLNKFAVPEFGLWIQALVACDSLLERQVRRSALDMISFVVGDILCTHNFWHLYI